MSVRMLKTLCGLVICGFLVYGGCGIWAFPPPETDSMHPWFLLWYLFLGLCGCKPCLAEGLEKVHMTSFLFFSPSRKGEEAGKDLVILCQQWICLVSLLFSPVCSVIVLGEVEEVSVPCWFCFPEVPGAGFGQRSSSCHPADQGLLVLLAKVPVNWIWGCFIAA